MGKELISSNMRSEYDMWLQDFVRIDGLLRDLHGAFILTRTDYRAYLAVTMVLSEIYSYLQAVVTDRDMDVEIRNVMKDGETKLSAFLDRAIKKERNHQINPEMKVFDIDFYNDLNHFRNTLLQVRQRAGMGIRVSKIPDYAKRDRNILGIPE